MKLNLKALKLFGILSLCAVILTSCGGEDCNKAPLKEYHDLYRYEKEYSILLEDMDIDGTFFKTYKHKYKIIRHDAEDKPFSETTGWVVVCEDFFNQNERNLGMSIYEKNKDGTISNVASPPGYRYIGDSRYGEWKTHNGTSFWAFYGQYMFMNQIFGMIQRPVYRRDYDEYHDRGYYRNRAYYGPKKNNQYKYGTNSPGTKKSHPNFFARRASKSGWSSSRSRSGSRSRGSGYGK